MRMLACRTVAFVVLAGTALVLTSGSETEDSASFQIQYHQALVELAELEYQTAMESNRKAAGAIAGWNLDRLKKNVMLSKKLLENAMRDAGDDMSTLHIVHAKELAKMAASDYRTALESKRLNPSAISAYRLEKTRLTAEIARLRVEMWKEPTSVSSLVDHMHWEIDRLSRDVLDLQQRLERLE